MPFFPLAPHSLAHALPLTPTCTHTFTRSLSHITSHDIRKDDGDDVLPILDERDDMRPGHLHRRHHVRLGHVVRRLRVRRARLRPQPEGREGSLRGERAHRRLRRQELRVRRDGAGVRRRHVQVLARGVQVHLEAQRGRLRIRPLARLPRPHPRLAQALVRQLLHPLGPQVVHSRARARAREEHQREQHARALAAAEYTAASAGGGGRGEGELRPAAAAAGGGGGVWKVG
mmetsp:Transcript_26892/g.65909  ORF Transcript_26892/g.65909 Transcript_26892/m.65909 type:complete len:230 (+) Transcript_26892:336-1025(+)